MIPTRNRVALLEKAVQSALSQDYENLEVIVSDNASTDGTCEAMKAHASDRRFTYHGNESDLGLARNWQKLLYEHATGKYAALLNDDDFFIDNEHLAKSVELLESRNLDIVFSGSKIIWNEEMEGVGRPTEIVFDLPQVVTRQWWLENFGRVLKKHTLFPNLVGSAVFNIEKARKFNAFYPPCYGLDYELALKFILAGDSGYFKECHWAERYHLSDAKTSDLERSFDGLFLFNRVYDFGLSLGIEKEKLLDFKRRGIGIFFTNFILEKFLKTYGCSMHTLLKIKNRIEGVDRGVFYRMLFSRVFLSFWLKNKNRRMHSVLRIFFRKSTHKNSVRS
jgi:glycosyltransferase involved in cell wall biosynthesis